MNDELKRYVQPSHQGLKGDDHDGEDFKVEFLRQAFDESIEDVEKKITIWTFGSSAGAELPFLMFVVAK